jgi:nucleotide-binding universal stress UspA family protein
LSIRSGDTLVLVHVFEQSGLEDKETLPALEKAVRSRLHWEAERLRKLGAMVEEKFLAGSPYEKLVETARTPSTRLVIIGALGHKVPKRWLIGSVAERTAESAIAPTIILRDPAVIESWATKNQPLKILVATDFSASSDAPLRWVKSLQEIGRCHVAIGHVDWPPDSSVRFGSEGAPTFLGNPPEVQRMIARDLKEKAERILGDESVKICMESGWGRTDLNLIDTAQREKVDLILVGSHQRQGLKRIRFGSVSRSILHHAPMNVAVVPMPKTDAPSEKPIPKIRRVLVTTDLSDLGNCAVPYAYSNLVSGGTVHLVHVIPPFGLPGPLMPHYQKKVVTKKDHARAISAARIRLR